MQFYNILIFTEVLLYSIDSNAATKELKRSFERRRFQHPRCSSKLKRFLEKIILLGKRRTQDILKGAPKFKKGIQNC